ncbi:MAG: DEAD/DEAH box helicase [Myxococcaceae bacterium]|nr:DEAD/DEAH box helicase [Myxococcaceae bacterium]
MTKPFYSLLSRELTERAARAMVSQLGPANPALLQHLQAALVQPLGERGSFIAPPAFEALFEWERDARTMADLPLLLPALVDAMASPPKEQAEYAFPKSRRPYVHQVKAWEALSGEPARSAIISTGTSSGKTECFLVPILNDLARELQGLDRKKLVGVRALFLYPLNALINSQRDRLLAWTAGFQERMRFCLYNGNTPNQDNSAARARSPSQVLDRVTLRESPPPILVTNTTMLEYMLVRAADAPIIEQSQGKLRWIVLDEAHTYVGSQAAELSLLLRRVLNAFQANAEQVRFVATSATIGGKEATAELQRYLADLAGVSPDRVVVIDGKRSVPALDATLQARAEPLPSREQARTLSPAELFQRLAGVAPVRALRDSLAQKAHSLEQISAELEKAQAFQKGEDKSAATLEWLDLLSLAQDDRGSLLPLRGHFFHRTQAGLWACSNSGCSGRSGPLDSPSWKFGKVFLTRRAACDACDSRVYDLVFCVGCGSEYLCAEDRNNHLEPLSSSTFEFDSDEGEDDDGLDDADEGHASRDPVVLICGREKNKLTSQPLGFSPRTGELEPTAGKGVIQIVLALSEEGRLQCVSCGQRTEEREEQFRPVRLGAPFFLGAAIPALLEQLSPGEKDHDSMPLKGRRLITFSDSRQGTARLAARLQLEADRNYVRSLIYHQLLERKKEADPASLKEIEGTIATLEKVVQSNPDLQGILSEKKRDLEQKRAQVHRPSKSWKEMARWLATQRGIRDWMPERQHQRYPPAVLRGEDLASLCLYREFVRRPKRQNSLETLGLVALSYPALEKLTNVNVPSDWKVTSLGLAEWRDFLKLCLDFFVRSHTSVYVPPGYLRMLGTKIRGSVVVHPDQPGKKNQIYPWPKAVMGRRLPRMARVLVLALGLDDQRAEHREQVDTLLKEAWSQLRQLGLLTNTEEGFILSLEEQAHVTLMSEGWICPITRRVLDTTLQGVSPYQTERWAGGTARCQKVVRPQPPLPLAFGRDEEGRQSPEAILRWLATDAQVKQAREQGVWTEFTDRITAFADYYQVDEHSAQQSKNRLVQLENSFKEGRVNVLSCSTTMEMGVDIGNLSAVTMANAPPGPANFLQRAGRAGRRGEARAVTLTICQSAPHAEAIFQSPLWPFTTPVHVPTVSLHSDRIIQRHIQSLLLSHFLRSFDEDTIHLTCEWFFVPTPEKARPYAETFADWLVDEAGKDEEIVTGLQRLTARSPLQGVEVLRLLQAAEANLRQVMERWKGEHEALKHELDQAGGRPDQDRKKRSQEPGNAARWALWAQLRRLEGEYLLRTLANAGFLPAHGFPLHVVPFVNTTAEELAAREQAEKDKGPEREDGYDQARGYPARHLAVAIREYAPGSSVVIDGMVYDSSGLTLHWRIPPGDEDHKELQILRIAWRCRHCGACDTTASLPEICERCGAQDLDKMKMLRPSGFAVDIYSKPHNDYSQQRFIPTQEPWISAGRAAWQALAHPEAGRIRYDPEGVILHWSAGLKSKGYAICLECGRAESEVASAKEAPPPSGFVEHRRLRGGRGELACEGNAHPEFAIQRNIRLGGAMHTDVVELQLQDPTTAVPITSEVACSSIAVALRQALAEKLGVRPEEIGWGTMRSGAEQDAARRSILLFDMADGGAGYVATLPGNLPALLRRAREILDCPRKCDQACHACLLGFDTQRAVDLLSWREGREVLSDALIHALSLPSELAVFGPETQLEALPLATSLLSELRHSEVQECRIYLGGAVADWEIGDWRLWPHLARWSLEGIRVSLMIPEDCAAQLMWDEGRALVARAQGAKIDLRITPAGGASVAGTRLIAEVGGAQRSRRWAVTGEEALIPGPDWGALGAQGRCVAATAGLALEPSHSRPPRADELAKARPGDFRELSVQVQLNGPIVMLGGRFWKLITDAVPALGQKLQSGPALAEIRYTDRYIRSPLTGRLLLEVLQGLKQHAGGLGQGSRVQVQVAEPGQDRRAQAYLDDDFAAQRAQQEVLSSLLSPLGAVIVTVKDRKQVAHMRELVLVWPDKQELIIRLDHGLGFFRTHPQVRHDFRNAPERQAGTIRAATFHIEKHALGAVPLYVSGVVQR